MEKAMCKKPATFLRTLAYRPDDYVCDDHAEDWVLLMDACGHTPQLKPITETDKPCACTEGRVQTVYTGEVK